jgi:hypothetical protein
MIIYSVFGCSLENISRRHTYPPIAPTINSGKTGIHAYPAVERPFGVMPLFDATNDGIGISPDRTVPEIAVNKSRKDGSGRAKIEKPNVTIEAKARLSGFLERR